MRLSIVEGTLYVDNFYFCFASGEMLPRGVYGVEVRYSHSHGTELVHVDVLGWMGAVGGCRIAVGRVKSESGLIACPATQSRLIAAVETAHERGDSITLEIR